MINKYYTYIHTSSITIRLLVYYLSNVFINYILAEWSRNGPTLYYIFLKIIQPFFVLFSPNIFSFLDRLTRQK